MLMATMLLPRQRRTAEVERASGTARRQVEVVERMPEARRRRFQYAMSFFAMQPADACVAARARFARHGARRVRCRLVNATAAVQREAWQPRRKGMSRRNAC